jgi:tetratricopeptide (TPR) repeat protein
MGYSAPGFLVVSRDVVKYADEAEYAPEFLPHELAHQWFPIAVSIQREEDGWLAESIAEYLAWRYLQANDPEAARRMVASAMRDSLEPEPLRPLSLGLKLFALEPWSVTHATLYQRGMLVFRTLETVIDRERVDRVLAEYYKRYHGKSASIADFRKICEEIAGRDLGWFFEYFLNGTRIPEIELRQVPSGAPGIVAGEIVVKNMPPEATVRVEMRIRTAKGAVEHSVATRGEVTPFSVNVPAPPLGIELDPDARILRWTEAARRHRAQQALLRQVGPLEDAKKITAALELCRQALALDPEDAALNQQRIRFMIGRLELQLKIPRERAREEFQIVLDGHSLDPLDTSFFRAWARVYRGKIAKNSGRLAAARAEAKAGLTLMAPALDSRVTWSDARGRETSAREALLELK